MKVKGRSTILILGDSTSMSIGVERKTHPFVLADRPIWPEDTQIINCSLPGMTAADAAAFFLRHKKEWINKRNIKINTELINQFPDHNPIIIIRYHWG